MSSLLPGPTKRFVEAATGILGESVEAQVFEAEVPTAAAAADLLGCHTSQIVNSLIFEVKGPKSGPRKAVLVCAPGDRRVDMRKLAAALSVSKNKVMRLYCFCVSSVVIRKRTPLRHLHGLDVPHNRSSLLRLLLFSRSLGLKPEALDPVVSCNRCTQALLKIAVLPTMRYERCGIKRPLEPF